MVDEMLPMPWQVRVSQGDTSDTNSNEHKRVPNPDVLICDVTEAVLHSPLKQIESKWLCDVYEFM